MYENIILIMNYFDHQNSGFKIKTIIRSVKKYLVTSNTRWRKKSSVANAIYKYKLACFR